MMPSKPVVRSHHDPLTNKDARAILHNLSVDPELPYFLTSSDEKERNAILKQLSNLALRKRAGTKPLEVECHGQNCFVPLRDAAGAEHLWIFPKTWLTQAQMLWPVYIAKYRDGKPYIERKVPFQVGDTTKQRKVAVHRLFLGLSPTWHEQQDVLEVEALNGDWLDWSGNNLRLRESSDALDHATTSFSEEFSYIEDDRTRSTRKIKTEEHTQESKPTTTPQVPQSEAITVDPRQYHQYVAWCQSLGLPAAPMATWAGVN